MNRLRQPKIHIAWWLIILEWILVRYVKVKREWIEAVRAATRTGPVLFVLRNRSLIDFLCLRGLMRKHYLPEVGFVTGLSPLVYMPVSHWILNRLFASRRAAARARLATTLAVGGTAVAFLRRPAIRGAFGSRPVAVDGVRMAVEAQGAVGGPLLVLPTVFLWGESAMQRMPGTMDFLFGSSEYPRAIRSIWLLLIRRSVHDLQVGTPLDVAAIRQERRMDDGALTSMVRAGVERQIELIRRSKLGALTKPSSRIMTEVVKSGRLRSQLEAIAEDNGMPPSEIEPRAWAIIKRLAADFRPRVVGIFGWVMTVVWKRLYTGIDISKADIEKMRAVVGERATLLLPSHKSHIDYLVLSQVMKENNLMMPHVAAGQNLAFWPLGWIFRSSGAFFIRRRFKNDRFYTAVVSAYVRRLVYEGYAMAVFIEGGRSRTGRLLRPRTGMLDMALKAMTLSSSADLNVLPVFIGYEHVIEERAHVAESRGRPKRAESLTGLIRTTTVLFRRFGMLHVRVGAPFSIGALLGSEGLTRDDLGSDSIRRTFASLVGYRNLAEINRITVATTSSILATVLLTLERAPVPPAALAEWSGWLAGFLRSAGVALSDTVAGWLEEGPGGAQRLERAIRVFADTRRIPRSRRGEGAYVLADPQRIPLDYYKNNIIHFLVPSALVAAACINAPSHVLGRDEVARQLGLGCRLFGRDFMLPGIESGAGRGCLASESVLTDTLALLVRHRVVETTADTVRLVNEERGRFLADVLRSYFEMYFAAIAALRERVVAKRDTPAQTLAREVCRRERARGRFTRPEGHTALNLRGALDTFKELRISRPGLGERPFEAGAPGDCLYCYLEAAIAASPPVRARNQ